MEKTGTSESVVNTTDSSGKPMRKQSVSNNKSVKQASSKKTKALEAKVVEPPFLLSSGQQDMLPWIVSNPSQIQSEPTKAKKTHSKAIKSKAKPKKQGKGVDKIVVKTKAKPAPKVRRIKLVDTTISNAAKPKLEAVSKGRHVNVSEPALVPAAVAAPASVVKHPVSPPLSMQMIKPIARDQAPVIWRKNRSLDAVQYWLRSSGRSVKQLLGFGPKTPQLATHKIAIKQLATKKLVTKMPISAQLRSKQSLLHEIAALRQENEELRNKLGLPEMPLNN